MRAAWSRRQRCSRVPILFTEHNAGGLGPTVAELADFAKGRLAHKITFDACRMADFLDRLGDRRDIVVAGCEAHVCVMQTALGLLDAGRRVYLVRDAVGSRRSESKETAIRAPGTARRRDRHHRDGRFRMARLGRASPFPRHHRADKIGGASLRAGPHRGKRRGPSCPRFRRNRAAGPSRTGLQRGAARPPASS